MTQPQERLQPTLGNTYQKYSANNLRELRAANDSGKNERQKQYHGVTHPAQSSIATSSTVATNRSWIGTQINNSVAAAPKMGKNDIWARQGRKGERAGTYGYVDGSPMNHNPTRLIETAEAKQNPNTTAN